VSAERVQQPDTDEELEPIPLRAGRSPSWWISTPRSKPRKRRISRTAGCWMSSIPWQFSIFE
jgi:hypothetical protein